RWTRWVVSRLRGSPGCAATCSTALTLLLRRRLPGCVTITVPGSTTKPEPISAAERTEDDVVDDRSSAIPACTVIPDVGRDGVIIIAAHLHLGILVIDHQVDRIDIENVSGHDTHLLVRCLGT